MKDSLLFLGIIILLVVMLLLPFGYEAVDSVTKALFEGQSYAKTLIFLIWFIFLFAVLLLKERGIAKPIKFKHSLIALIALLAILWLFQLFLNVTFMYDNNMPADTTAAILVSEDNTIQWSATQLSHIHITKGALYPIIGLIPFKGFDSGYPMSNILPFPHSIIFLLLAIGLLVLIVNEFLQIENKVEQLLFAIFSYGALVSVFDGGPFSIIGKITIALLVALFLLRRGEIKSYQFFLVPFFILAGILYFASFHFKSYIFAFGAYEIFLIGTILSAILIFKARKIEKPVWAAIMLILLYYAFGYLAEFGFGADLSEAEETTLFIYGLPQGTTEESLTSAFGDSVEVVDWEIYNYVSFARIKPKIFMKSEVLEKKLREALKPGSYLFILKGFDRHRAVIRSENDVQHLLSLNSNYISLKKELVAGKEELVVEGLFPHPYLSLFVLNNLYFEKGIEKPIVFSKTA